MLLGRTECDGNHNSSKNAAIGTGSSARQQLSTVEKGRSDFQIPENASARPLRSPLCPLCYRFARFRWRRWDGGNPRRRASPSAGLEPFPYEIENGPAILGDHFQPCHLPHHGEIDAAETEARQEDVDAITQGLVIQRVDCMRQRLRTISLDPSPIYFGVSFFDAHLQRRVGHGKRDELLP